MKDFLHRIVSLLSLNGRDWPVFLLSLLLAFSIWFIHNLALKYNDFITVPVVAECNIEGHAAMSATRSDVVARCRATGYNIVRAKLTRNKPVKIHFSRLHSKGGEMFYITAGELQEYTPLIFGETTTLEYYVSDTLFFRFPYEEYKKVPVYPVHQIAFEPQYTMVGRIEVEPDSVLVYGEPYKLENVEFAYTEPIRMSSLKTNVQGLVKLEKMRGLRYAEDDVRYTINVARYVEMPAKVPVNVRNVPEGQSMKVYPSIANVVFRCIYPHVHKLEENVSFYVDYNEFASSRSGKCVVRADNLPGYVIDYSIEPAVVECVVTDMR